MLNRRLLVVAAVAGLALASCNKAGPKAASADDMTLGNPSAPIKVVEYASASCSHCARFNNEVFPAFKAKYIDTGKVHYTLREVLTSPENFAAAGFLTARCAGKDKYFTVLDAIYKNQEQMFQTQDFRGGLLQIAQSVGMTEPQFNACVSDEKALNAISKRSEKNAQDAPEGTPTFYVNGKKQGAGEMTMAQLDAAIAAAGK